VDELPSRAYCNLKGEGRDPIEQFIFDHEPNGINDTKWRSDLVKLIEFVRNPAKAENQSKLLAVFQYGSRVYQTVDRFSDYDFIEIWSDDPPDDVRSDADVTRLSYSQFRQLVEDHEISVLECVFSDSSKRQLFDGLPLDWNRFELNLEKLRRSISAKSSNSWVKAKKKIEVEKDRNLRVAFKSLFHSIRILDFGIQIAVFGEIVNFSSMIELHDSIKTDCQSLVFEKLSFEEQWKFLHSKYSPIKKKYEHTFKKVAPIGDKPVQAKLIETGYNP
jgi:hypothetical protein